MVGNCGTSNIFCCKALSLILTVSRSSPPIPLGSVSYENHVSERGERYVWLPPNVVDRLKTQRRPGEGYSDVIPRLLAAGDGIEGTRAR